MHTKTLAYLASCKFNELFVLHTTFLQAKMAPLRDMKVINILFFIFIFTDFIQVASWWDYGYQTTAMANRTVIVDNNTWNNTHIATVGTAMSSPEKAAWEIFNSLDVKYVLVVFGGWFCNSILEAIFPE